MTIRRTVTGAAALAALALTLTGCAQSGARETVISSSQLRDTITNPSTPPGFDWDETTDITTVQTSVRDIREAWADNEGKPREACYDAYAASSIVSSRDSGSTLDQPDFELGRFEDSRTQRHYTLLGVRARVFGSAAQAETFVDGLADAVAACAGGYTMSTDGDPFWVTTGFRLTEDSALGASNVRAVSLEEIVSPSSEAAGYRTVFLERGNVVVAIVAEIAGGEDVDYTDQDQIAQVTAEALGGIGS